MTSNNSDAYHWRAYYADGERYDEYDRQGTLRAFASIDQARLVGFELLPVDRGVLRSSDLKPFTLYLGPGMKLIFFRRRGISVNMQSGVHTHAATVHCLGWEKAGHMVYCFVLPDGSVVLSDSPNAVDAV